MRAEEHWDKAARLEASRKRGLNHQDDYEIIIWSCIHGGAQLANVFLHRHGITPDSQDQIHTDVPELKQELPPHVVDFLGVLKSIEDLGPRFIRGFEPMESSVVTGCLESYEKLKTLAKQTL
jgi:hypothetical protein